MYTLKIKIPSTATLAESSDVPEVTKDEIMFSLQNVKCRKTSDKYGIATDVLKDSGKFHKGYNLCTQKSVSKIQSRSINTFHKNNR